MEMTNQHKMRSRAFRPGQDQAFLQSVLNRLPKEDQQFLMPSLNVLGDGDTPVKVYNEVSTNGWDTVCAIRAADLNRAIESKKTYPQDVDYHYDDEGDIANLKGSFLPWSISSGGDGSNLNIKIPFLKGTFSHENVDHCLDGGEAIAQVKLAYFPEILNAPQPGSYDLKVSCKSDNPDDPVVSIIQYRNENHKLPKTVAGAMGQVLGDWLINNLTIFTTIFSTVSLEAVGEKTEFKWLKSTYMSYAYTDLGNLSNSVFGILCMTNNRSAGSLGHQIDSACLQGEEKASFIIKKELFAKYQFLPALPYAFQNASASDFTLSATENEITAENLTLSKVDYGACTYDPKVESFKVSFQQSEIQTETVVRTNISPGIDSIATITTYHTLTLGEKDGKQYMNYVTTQDTKLIKQTDVSPGIIVTEVIADIILAVLGIVAGEVIEKVIKKVIVCIVIAIVAALIAVVIHEIIESCVAGQVADKLPSISPMVNVASRQILWPMCDPKEENRFTLDHVFYNGDIALCGTPVYML